MLFRGKYLLLVEAVPPIDLCERDDTSVKPVSCTVVSYCLGIWEVIIFTRWQFVDMIALFLR